MKKIFLLLFLIPAVVGMYSCGNKEAEDRAEKIKEGGLSQPDSVKLVSAIGKIEPEEGLIEIASEYGGIVSKIFKKEGDLVKAGDTLIELKTNVEKSDETVLQNQIEVQRAKAAAEVSNVAQYEAQLAELERDLAAGERLVETGAETRQNVENTRKDRNVARANLDAAQKNAAAARSDIAVLQAQLEKAKESTGSRSIRAEKDGQLVLMDLKVGTAVSALTSIATLAPSGKLVVHGEIDEMFAHLVKKGDKLRVKLPGTNTSITQAEISYLSPILQEKSLFYEKAGEQSDRRVRRFKAVLDKEDQVLINQKVECEINL